MPQMLMQQPKIASSSTPSLVATQTVSCELKGEDCYDTLPIADTFALDRSAGVVTALGPFDICITPTYTLSISAANPDGLNNTILVCDLEAANSLSLKHYPPTGNRCYHCGLLQRTLPYLLELIVQCYSLGIQLPRATYMFPANGKPYLCQCYRRRLLSSVR